MVVDPEALLRYDVSLAEVIERIEANNANVGAQYIEKNAEQLIVRSVGLALDIADLERIVVKTVDGSAGPSAGDCRRITVRARWLRVW